MEEISKAKIFLSAERGLHETTKSRSNYTFNFGDYFNEYKIPFGDLYLLNDDSLAGGYSVEMTVEESSYIILLPVVGATSYKDSTGNENLINSGEVQLINLHGGTSFEVSNPYENELVNFLQLWIKTGSFDVSQQPLLLNFNLAENKNRLLDLVMESTFPNISIGQFRGREDALYKMKNSRHGLFVFVIEGAFEVEGRLLHPRDGLALWDVGESIELEALSNEAIVFLVEVRVD